MASLTRSGGFLLRAFMVVAQATGGCSSGDDDDATGTGGGAGTGKIPAASVEACQRCTKSADCKSGFCNAVNDEAGVCTTPVALDCKLSDTLTLRGLRATEFTTSEPLPVPAAPGAPVPVDADDPELTYSGRIDFTDGKAPRFSSPSVSVRARFNGTTAVVKLEDQFRYGKRNYFDVRIDEGTPAALSLKISPNDGTSYTVASGLPEGEHSIVLVKRSEANIGYADFLGFEFDGPVLDAGPAPKRQVEIIGDSISCGVGADLPAHPGLSTDQIESTFCKEDDWGVPYHDAELSFGAVAARSFGAEYHVTAVSGIGLIRNYSSNPSNDLRPMPEVYDKLFLEQTDSPDWDTSKYQPDAVLVALGTNDFSPGDNPPSMPRERMTVDLFVAEYEKFIDTLRGYYPDAEIFVLGSPMLGNGYPDDTYHYRDDHQAALAQIEADYADQGGKVHAVNVQKVLGKGCGTHPSAAEHAKVAAEDLEPALAAIMGW